MGRPIFRQGLQVLQRVLVDSGTVIAVGDAVWLDTDDVKPASDFTWDTNLATTQASFVKKFLGIAAEAHTAAEGAAKTAISVDVSRDAAYACLVASATYQIGAPMGLSKASGNALLNQSWEAAVKTSACAYVFEQTGAAATLLELMMAPAYRPTSLLGQVAAAS